MAHALNLGSKSSEIGILKEWHKRILKTRTKKTTFAFLSFNLCKSNKACRFWKKFKTVAKVSNIPNSILNQFSFVTWLGSFFGLLIFFSWGEKYFSIVNYAYLSQFVTRREEKIEKTAKIFFLLWYFLLLHNLSSSWSSSWWSQNKNHLAQQHKSAHSHLKKETYSKKKIKLIAQLIKSKLIFILKFFIVER